MAVTQATAGPYAPTRTMMDIIERHRDRGLPKPINAETLQRAGLVTESLTSRTLQALTTLDLIDESGTPTQVFEGIRLAPEAEYKKRLEDWLKAAYSDVFSFVDPTKDDAMRVRDAFRGYQPTGQQDRMVNLFIGLCTAAGLLIEKPESLSNKPPAPARQRITPPAKTKQKSTTPAGGDRGGNSSSVPLNFPPAMNGLLASLPDPAKGWTKEERNKFYLTFGAVIDFVYPIVEPQNAAADDDAAA